MPLKDTIVNVCRVSAEEKLRSTARAPGTGPGYQWKYQTDRPSVADKKHKTEATLARGGAQSRRAKVGNKQERGKRLAKSFERLEQG